MATVFTPAEEVQDIAETLINQYHKHLVGVRVDYLFSDNTPSKGGKDIWGTMKKVSGLTAYEGADKQDKERGTTDPFFVMTISEPVWKNLSSKEKTALVDHELCHAGVDVDPTGKIKLTTICHDVEEFSPIIERYGLWRKDVEAFFEAGKNAGKTKKKSKDEETAEEDE